jgi:hypothetical protein
VTGLLDPPMRFTVDSWDVGYGSSLDADGLAESNAETILDVETPMRDWAAVDPDPRGRNPDAVLFVDGVRRIDARVWIQGSDGPDAVLTGSPAAAGLCASYAAGVVCCCAGRAHLIAADVRRGMFTLAREAADIATRAGTYRAFQARASETAPLPVALSAALQQQLAETEIDTAVSARTSAGGDHPPITEDLLVIDGPLRGRSHLPRAVGFIKSHQTEYLPAELNALVGRLRPGQRTPVFGMGTTWDRYSWYLRLPGQADSPWAGVVRVEASADLPVDSVIALAGQTQRVLGRYASEPHKDARAPQNLYPIAGLEKQLRHRLGDQQFVYRALRTAAPR